MYFMIKGKIKKHLFIVLFLLIISLLFVPSNYASWDIYKRVSLRNKAGHRLVFECNKSKYIRVWLKLNTQKEENVVFNKLPVYRVDNYDIHKIGKEKYEKKIKILVGHYISWIISNRERPSKELREFMNGREVVFQYYRDDGKIMEAVFPLDGAKEAIEEILN